jgi:hypothetical protein
MARSQPERQSFRPLHARTGPLRPDRALCSTTIGIEPPHLNVSARDLDGSPGQPARRRSVPPPWPRHARADTFAGTVGRELVRYYNGARPSQATHGIPEPCPELRMPPTTGRMSALPVLGGIGPTRGFGAAERFEPTGIRSPEPHAFTGGAGARSPILAGRSGRGFRGVRPGIALPQIGGSL